MLRFSLNKKSRARTHGFDHKGVNMLKSAIVAAAMVLGFQAHAELTQVEMASLTTITPVIADIPLHVGDSTDYKLSGGILNGTAHVFVRETTNDGIWVQQDIDLGMMGKEKIEALYDKNTGKVLKILANGQEQAIPDPANMKVIETRQEHVTVPKGDFACMYLKIHDNSQNNDTETWVTKEVPVGGMVKTIAPSQIGAITLELTDFKKAQ
jgi:hypothetical protein